MILCFLSLNLSDAIDLSYLKILKYGKRNQKITYFRIPRFFLVFTFGDSYRLNGYCLQICDDPSKTRYSCQLRLSCLVFGHSRIILIYSFSSLNPHEFHIVSFGCPKCENMMLCCCFECS